MKRPGKRNKIPSLDKRYARHRSVTQGEVELWKQETEGKLPPPERKKPKAKAKAEPKKHTPEPIPVVRKKKEPPPPTVFDARTRSKIHRDIMTPEASLDLHGHTQLSAHSALVRFIDDCQERGIRLTLIITGKGRIGEGLLRALLPRWLEESPLRGRIIAYDVAGPRHGGAGAWYVRIRKR